MMNMTTIQEAESMVAFAKQAGAEFAANPGMTTFGSVEPGSLLAIRWGIDGGCVVVVRLDENFPPTNFQGAAHA